MVKQINIAIDGYSSCGKGTLAKELAKHLNYVFIDSGAMYRAVTLYLMNHNVDVLNENAVESVLGSIALEFKQSVSNDRYEIHLNGENVDAEIRELRVASKVSEVAKISSVRRKLVEMQQTIGAQKGVVMDGRDIGTVVFPNAELKIFMTASPEVRAERRYNEMIAAGKAVLLEDVRQNLMDRDRIDSSRDDSPLTMNDSYHILDNSNLNRDEQFNLAMSWVQELLD